MSREEWLRQGFSDWLAKGPDTAFLSPEETAEMRPSRSAPRRGSPRASRRSNELGEFSRPYPFHVLYRMLGLPIEDIETFYRLTIAQLVTSFANWTTPRKRRRSWVTTSGRCSPSDA